MPVLATASTVFGTLAAEQKAAQERTKTATDAVAAYRVEAEKEAIALRSQISALPTGTPDLAKTTAASVRAGEMARGIHALESQLLHQSIAADTIREQLKATKARRHTEYENALLTKFFHQMEPTVCPRCAAAVTKERRSAEPDQHKCSVCTSDLNLDAFDAAVVVASSVDPQVASSLMEAVALSTAATHEKEPAPRSEIDALGEALRAAEDGMASLGAQLEAGAGPRRSEQRCDD